MDIPEFQAARYRAVVEYIKAHPKEYNQSSWHSACGTTACFAGHAQIMSGKSPNRGTARRDARMWLGLTHYEADYLFDCCQRLEVIAGFNRDGFDRDGYDRDDLDCMNKPRGEP